MQYIFILMVIDKTNIRHITYHINRQLHKIASYINNHIHSETKMPDVRHYDGDGKLYYCKDKWNKYN